MNINDDLKNYKQIITPIMLALQRKKFKKEASKKLQQEKIQYCIDHTFQFFLFIKIKIILYLYIKNK